MINPSNFSAPSLAAIHSEQLRTASSTLQSQRAKKQLLYFFWMILAVLLFYELLATTPSVLINVGAMAITVSALLPSFLWCSDRAKGMPLFPVFGLSFIWSYALPLVSNHPVVSNYPVNNQLFASMTTSGFLLLGSAVWFQFVKRVPKRKAYYRGLEQQQGTRICLINLLLAVVFNLVGNSGVFSLFPLIVYTSLRSITLGLSAISVFILAYSMGAKLLTGRQTQFFILLLSLYLMSSVVSFLLIGMATVSMIAIVAYTIGRQKIPVIAVIILWALLSFLHAGKAEMRSAYGSPSNQSRLQIWDYPALFVDWGSRSIEAISVEKAASTSNQSSFSERASVIQMLMLSQDKSPQQTPFLNGETYRSLHQVVTPRILLPNKARSQEGTHLLSVHYGLKTWAETYKTSIAWGMLAEAYANFGLLGCTGLAVALGTLYGQLTRWSINAPMLSLPSLFSVLMITFAFQSEWTAGTFLAAFSQSSLVICMIAAVFMRKRRTEIWFSQGGR